MRMRILVAAFLAGFVPMAPNSEAQSQVWPERPVKIVVPFAPGGNSDSIARMIAQRFGNIFGQQFVVENRAGAGGIIATESVARAPADGYTLLMASTLANHDRARDDEDSI
jgi:tripartite-type tricarboxylate transporter receptor subunit TctC